MRTHSLRVYAPILSLLTMLVATAPAAAATAQQAAGRRTTPSWVWLLLLLAIVLLVWWLWNSSRHKTEQKQSAAAQVKLPESIGDAIDRAPPGARIATPAAKPAVPAPAGPAPSESVAETIAEATTAEEIIAEEIVVENIPPTPGVALAGGKSQTSAPAKTAAGEAAVVPAVQRSAPAVEAFDTTPAAAPAETPPAAKPKRSKSKQSGDDLTVIEGIGPKISTILHQAGIDTYAILGATSVDDLRKLLADNNLRFADPSTWPEQAALAGTDPGKLAELQSNLKGGRRQ